jgi:phosphate transport system substrate-binding protein
MEGNEGPEESLPKSDHGQQSVIELAKKHGGNGMRPLKIVLCFALLVARLALAEPIRVGGTGSASPLMQELGLAYARLHPGSTIQVMMPPPGTGGGVSMLIAGKLDVALAGRKLKPEEQSQVGAVFPYARTPLVFAGRGQRKSGFTRDQISDLYSGRLSHWDDVVAIRLLMRSPYESDTLQLRALSPAVSEALQLAFARPGMTYAENDIDAIDLLARIPGSFGTTTLGLLRKVAPWLQIYPVDGVMPTLATLADGSYPLSKSIYIVAGRHPSEATRRFIEFLRTPQALEVLRRGDYLPLPLQ